MNAELLDRYNLDLNSLGQDVLALTETPSPKEATDIFELLHIHSHGFAFADAELHRAALKCIEWGAEYAPRPLSDIVLNRIPSALSSTSIIDLHTLLVEEQKGFVALHNGESWQGIVEASDIQDALRYELGQMESIYISGASPPLIDIDAPITLAKELLRRSTSPVLIVIQDGKSVGYLNANCFVERLRPEPLPKGWETGLGQFSNTVKTLGEAADACGCGLYMVGGAVRDLLSDEPIVDLDCTLLGDPAQLANFLKDNHGGQVRHDLSFGAIHWTSPLGQTIDITIARLEAYPNREDLPAVLSSHLLHDLKRRDFSINAMAIGLHSAQWGTLIDPYGGYSDLKSKLIRSLHGMSFIHDPTRIIRAARYSSRFNFSLEADTNRSIKAALLLHAGKRISRERLGNEINQLLSERYPVKGWTLLKEWGCLERWLPELAHPPQLISKLKSILAYTQLHTIDSSAALWLCLACSLSSGARKRLARLTATDKNRHTIWTQISERVPAIAQKLQSISSQDPKDVQMFWGEALQNSTAEIWSNLAMDFPKAIHWWKEDGQHIPLQVDGVMLQEHGIPQGPQVGTAIRAAWRAAWNGGNKDAQLSAALGTR